MLYLVSIHCSSTYTSFDWVFLLQWLTPVVLFIAAYLVNNLLKKINRKKQLNNLNNYFQTTLNALIKQNNSQINLNIDCINRVKNFHENEIIIKQVAGNSIKRINEINFDDLFELFVLNAKDKDDNIKLFHDLNNNLDYIETATPSLFSANLNITSALTNIGNQWNSVFEKILELRNTLALSHNLNQPNGVDVNFIHGFLGIYDLAMKQEKELTHNFYNSHHKLIFPLIDFSKKFPQDPAAKALIQLCASINIFYETIIHIRQQHRKFLIQITRGLIKANIELKRFKRISKT